MNFYNPYLYSIPVESTASSLLSKFSLSSLISGTSKTLNIINQTIPVIKQVSPMVKNFKTMFNVMNEFKKTDIENTTKKQNNVIEEKKEDNGPTFFI